MQSNTLERYNFHEIPLIDIGCFVGNTEGQKETAEEIREACKASGFFYVKGHGVKKGLRERLLEASKVFFELPMEEKMQIHMKKGGKAWRGYFPAGEELTSGKIDLKQGIYFGEELPEDHELVKAGTQLHGRNLFPQNPPELKELVLEWIAEMFKLGGTVM